MYIRCHGIGLKIIGKMLWTGGEQNPGPNPPRDGADTATPGASGWVWRHFGQSHESQERLFRRFFENPDTSKIHQSKICETVLDFRKYNLRKKKKARSAEGDFSCFFCVFVAPPCWAWSMYVKALGHILVNLTSATHCPGRIWLWIYSIYRSDFFTRGSISLPHHKLLYYRSDFFTTGAISVLLHPVASHASPKK